MVPMRTDETVITPAIEVTNLPIADSSEATSRPTSLVPADILPLVTIDPEPEIEVQLVAGIGRAEMPGGSIADSFASAYVVRAEHGFAPIMRGAHYGGAARTVSFNRTLSASPVAHIQASGVIRGP